MRYTIEKNGHIEHFKTMKAAKDAMLILGAGFYGVTDNKTNKKSLYMVICNGIMRIE